MFPRLETQGRGRRVRALRPVLQKRNTGSPLCRVADSSSDSAGLEVAKGPVVAADAF